MENYFIVLFGILVSCITYTVIVFQFIEERYSRIYNNKICYMVVRVVICISMMGINILGNPILNLLGWIVLICFVAIKLYSDQGKSVIRRVSEIAILFLVFAACETVGYLISQFIIWQLGINNTQPMLAECFHMTFSKIFIILFYYGIITKLWASNIRKVSSTQWMTYVVIIIYSIVNLAVIEVIISNGVAISFGERLLLLINMLCIVFADMFLLFFSKYTEENNLLKMQLNLTEQQADLQYEYYVQQEDKYNESIKILHDVNKHLNMIQEIYKNNEKSEAIIYAKEIGKMLEPLVVKQYVSNPILNILLNDKIKYASMRNINFQIDIGEVELGFMKPMEITTVFGNLIDNAIDACSLVDGEIYIFKNKCF